LESHFKHQHHSRAQHLNELLEGTVDGRAHFGALIEVDGGDGALADTIWGKFEFL